MRGVIQRVSEASVHVEERNVASIGTGLLVFIGIESDDRDHDLKYIVDKTLNLRIFHDRADQMNLSLMDLRFELLVISQFTLYGDTRKGRRPSYNRAAAVDHAREIFSELEEMFRREYGRCFFGEFQEHMNVRLVNDGPVTLLVDSKKEF